MTLWADWSEGPDQIMRIAVFDKRSLKFVLEAQLTVLREGTTPIFEFVNFTVKIVRAGG